MYQKLELHNPMRRTSLIQRLETPTGMINPFSFGSGALAFGGFSLGAAELLAKIYSFDYMGAAQFEDGSVPRAFGFLAEQASAWSWMGHTIPNPPRGIAAFLTKRGMGQQGVVAGEHRGVLYICPTSYEDGVKVVIDNLLTDERAMHLHEYCGLKDALDAISQGESPRYAGWLEINNGFMFFVDFQMFENTKRLFGIQ